MAASLVALASCTAGDELLVDEGSPVAVDREAPLTLDGATLIYEQLVEYDGEGVLVDATASGVEIDEAMRERIARPYRHLDETEVLEDEAWVEVTEDGHTRHGYRVWSRPNENPMEPEVASGPPVFDDEVQGLLDADWAEDERDVFTGIVAGMPEWDLPLPLEPALNSDEAVAANKEARWARAAERAELFETLTGDLAEQIEANGGVVRLSNPVTGWLLVDGPRETLDVLVAHESLGIVSLSDEDPEAEEEYGWALGDGGTDDRSDWDDYHDRGFTGETGGATGSAMRVAIIEHTAIRDTACGFKDGAGCSGASSRFDGLYDCETNGVNNSAANEGTGSGICLWGPGIPACCSETSPYPTATTRGMGVPYEYGHGNRVSSIVGADYTEHQGDGHQLGDSPWASSTCTVNSDCSPGLTCAAGKCRHSSTWEASATGVAPDADMLFFGRASTGAAKAHAIWSVFLLEDADVISLSQGANQERCDPRAEFATEEEAENAYDDGKLFVACAGNIGGSSSCTSSTCGTWSAGSQAKTLAVTRFNSSDPACSSDFSDCKRPDTDQCDGGADVSVNGTTYSGAASIIDIVAPSSVSRTTDESSPATSEGEVVSDTFGGCSAATPHVAAVAALVKEYFVDFGATWTGYPGRMHTLMLLLTDRSYLSGSSVLTRTKEADDEWGLGRLKARFFGGSSESASIGVALSEDSWSAGSTSTYTWQPFGTVTARLSKTPLPNDTVMVKCVMHQAEDFSGMSEPEPVSISNLNLRVRISTTNGSGVCPSTPFSTVTTRTDTSRDWKSHVTVVDADVSGGLGGKCVYVQQMASFVDTGGISATTACYYAAAYDDEG